MSQDEEETLSAQSQPPRAVRTFTSHQEAVAFIAGCLESGAVIQLLAEIHGVSQQVGRSRVLVDRFKSVFAQLQALHAQRDLRRVYADAEFPTGAEHHELDGYLAQQGDLSIQFVRLARGWALESIDYL